MPTLTEKIRYVDKTRNPQRLLYEVNADIHNIVLQFYDPQYAHRERGVSATRPVFLNGDELRMKLYLDRIWVRNGLYQIGDCPNGDVPLITIARYHPGYDKTGYEGRGKPTIEELLEGALAIQKFAELLKQS